MRCYSEAIEAICDGTYSAEKVKAWDERLAMPFNRGFWDGYYMGQRLGEWSGKYGSSATRVKEYVAKGELLTMPIAFKIIGGPPVT